MQKNGREWHVDLIYLVEMFFSQCYNYIILILGEQ